MGQGDEEAMMYDDLERYRELSQSARPRKRYRSRCSDSRSRSGTRDRSQSRPDDAEAPPSTLVLRPAGGEHGEHSIQEHVRRFYTEDERYYEDIEDPLAGATMGPNELTGVLITVTKNFQGAEGQAAYCLAGMAADLEGNPRLIRFVPDNAHFWSDASLPDDFKEMHVERNPQSSEKEPSWPFVPIVVSFEHGPLPDTITGPHRHDDVTTRNLTFWRDIEDYDELFLQLMRIAHDELAEVWPREHWASKKSLKPDAPVPSLAIFEGLITEVQWRDNKSPAVSFKIGEETVENIPYGAHRIHNDEKGYGMLNWAKDRGEPLLILFGLSREFKTDHGTSECPILLLRIFPAPP